jgi:hypothetical protein
MQAQEEYYITVTGVEEDTLIRMKNGNDSRLNLQLYQGGHNKTYIPSLKDICISNIYALNCLAQTTVSYRKQ